MNNLTTINNLNYDIQQNIYFRIGKNSYAIPLRNVLEVMKLPKLDYPQKLPANFVGVLKVNNLVLNVLDIRFYLDIKIEKYSTSNKLIIVKTDETLFGIIVDEIIDIINFETVNIEHLPFITENQIIETSYNVNGENILIINTYALERIIKNGYPEKDIDITDLFPTDSTSLEIFKQRATSLSQRLNLAITNNVFSDNKFLSFVLNNTTYCINLKYIKEIAKAENIIPIPCSPDYIEGLMTLKGDFVTVVNLKNFLNFTKTEYSTKAKVVVIDSNEYKLGFLLDEINDILNVNEETLNKKDINSENLYIEAEIIEKNNVKFVLNMEKILSDPKMYIEEN